LVSFLTKYDKLWFVPFWTKEKKWLQFHPGKEKNFIGQTSAIWIVVWWLENRMNRRIVAFGTWNLRNKNANWWLLCSAHP